MQTTSHCHRQRQIYSSGPFGDKGVGTGRRGRDKAEKGDKRRRTNVVITSSVGGGSALSFFLSSGERIGGICSEAD